MSTSPVAPIRPGRSLAERFVIWGAVGAVLLLILAGGYRLRIHYGEQALRETKLIEWAQTQRQIAHTLSRQFEYDAAAEILRSVIKEQQRVLGPEHPGTLQSRNILVEALLNSAITHGPKGKLAEADAESRAVLSIRARVLGPEHRDTLASRSMMAGVLSARGKHAEAEAEQRAILAIMQRVLGPEHPDTLKCRNNLAVALERQGKYAETEAEFRAVLAIRERALGATSPDFLNSCRNLAHCLEVQGKMEEALVFARRALEGYRKKLGTDDPVTRSAMAHVMRLVMEQK